jgi:hypothetical protein
MQFGLYANEPPTTVVYNNTLTSLRIRKAICFIRITKAQSWWHYRLHGTAAAAAAALAKPRPAPPITSRGPKTRNVPTVSRTARGAINYLSEMPSPTVEQWRRLCPIQIARFLNAGPGVGRILHLFAPPAHASSSERIDQLLIFSDVRPRSNCGGRASFK